MIRKGCCAGTSPRLGRCGGISPRLTKCNCLAGCRVQPAPTRPGARRNLELITSEYVIDLYSRYDYEVASRFRRVSL